MKTHNYNHAIAIFSVEQKDNIEVNGEYEWRLNITPQVKLTAGTKFVITVSPYQHQLSEEYLQSYDYWKPNYIYALAEEESLEIDVSIKKVKTAFSHIKRWNDSCREAHVTLINDFDIGQEFFIQFGGVDRPFLRGDAAPSRVGIRAHNKDVCRMDKRLEVQLAGESQSEIIDVFPAINLLPGKPHNLSIFAPTVVVKDETFRLSMLAVDRFENPILDYQVSLLILVFKELETGNETRLDNVNYGYVSYSLPIGRYLVTVENTSMSVSPAVIKVEEQPKNRMYWGDTHCHSNLTANIRDNDCGANPHNAYHYAKHVSRMDFVCLSEQTFIFNEDRTVNIDKKTWQTIGTVCDKYNQEGEFVTFCGFELHGKRGDTVVLYRNSLTEEKYPDCEVNIIHDIWDYYKGRDFITIPHLHRFCNGRSPKHVDNQDTKFEAGFELKNWEPSSEDETMVEVYSAQWGRFEYKNNPMLLKARNNVENNTVVDFLKRGKKWGFVSNSDGHDGNPGYGGVTGVQAVSQTRADIFDAMKLRQTIATTHPRMFLNMELDNSSIGTTVASKKRHTLLIDVLTPGLINKVELVADGEIFERWYVEGHSFVKQLDELNLGNASFVYLRVFQEDKHIGWTSPIWVA